MTKKLHFAYTVPLRKTILGKAIDKLMVKTGMLPLHRGGMPVLISWQKPIRAPHSISYHLLQSFKARLPVNFYNIYERILPEFSVDDVFVGQPVPDGGFGPVRSLTDDAGSITSRVIRQRPSDRNFIIMPYTHDPMYVSWARDLVRANKGGLILVGGKIWERDWLSKSPFADIPIAKKIHVEMGIDPDDYPVVKKTWNPQGKRKYLYIGHTGWYKNTRELERIAERIPGFEGGHIGGGEIKGWKKIADFASLSPEFMSKIADEYDIFVNTSSADAQATTILEQMCFGFVVACTPESGYDIASLQMLKVNDTGYNVAVLEELQQADESELAQIALSNRQAAIDRHSWERFTSEIVDFIKL